MTEVFFGDDLIPNSLLYFFDIGHVSINFPIPDVGVVKREFKDSGFVAWY